MTAKNAPNTIPVVDVDQAFPTMAAGPSGPAVSSTAVDQTPSVRTAIRNVLGVRSRTEDPKAFVDALTSAFRLVKVEGHVESRFVPRGYAVQADLGAVSGGQASLYRRATIARAEILRILDGLTSLRSDGDADDMEAYRVIVRNSVQSLVDEMGLPGGPRVAMVDSYFAGLVGRGNTSPDQVAGQLGALRERFGLTDDNVNTIEEEGRRTSFWTLVDLVTDLRDAWRGQRKRFTGAKGSGFLGTELIHISRLMEAATDQVEELESVLDSVLVGGNERQTIQLDDEANLTLDGLLSWLTSFLHDEGRRLAQDAGRDGIVSALAPTAVALASTFKSTLADRILDADVLSRGGDENPVRYLPASCCEPLPPGMYAARVRVAVASLCRLLLELARRALRIGRYAGVVLIDIAMSRVDGGFDKAGVGTAVNVEFRGLNLREGDEPAFIPLAAMLADDDCSPEQLDVRELVRPVPGTVTGDGESISALFREAELNPILAEAYVGAIPAEGLIFPAANFRAAVIDHETLQVVHAPPPRTWPRYRRADKPRTRPSDGEVLPKQPYEETAGMYTDYAGVGVEAAERSPATHVSGTRMAGPVARGLEHLDHLEQAVADASVRVAVREGALAEVVTELEEEKRRRDRLTGAQASAATRRITSLTDRVEELARELDDLRALRDHAERARDEAEVLLAQLHGLAAEETARTDHIDEEGH